MPCVPHRGRSVGWLPIFVTWNHTVLMHKFTWWHYYRTALCVVTKFTFHRFVRWQSKITSHTHYTCILYDYVSLQQPLHPQHIVCQAAPVQFYSIEKSWLLVRGLSYSVCCLNVIIFILQFSNLCSPPPLKETHRSEPKPTHIVTHIYPCLYLFYGRLCMAECDSLAFMTHHIVAREECEQEKAGKCMPNTISHIWFFNHLLCIYAFQFNCRSLSSSLVLGSPLLWDCVIFTCQLSIFLLHAVLFGILGSLHFHIICIRNTHKHKYGFLRYWLHSHSYSHFHFHISFSISCTFSSISIWFSRSHNVHAWIYWEKCNKWVQKDAMLLHIITLAQYCIGIVVLMHLLTLPADISFAHIQTYRHTHILLLFFLLLSFCIFAHQVENSIYHTVAILFSMWMCACVRSFVFFPLLTKAIFFPNEHTCTLYTSTSTSNTMLRHFNMKIKYKTDCREEKREGEKERR